jgi:hypothetical protein
VSGRKSIVTAAGAGGPARIKTFRFDLYTPNAGAASWCAPSDALPPGVPRQTSDFVAFDGDSGGVSVATGWIAGGTLGGAQSIVVAQTGAPGAVELYSSGSALDGEPRVYLRSADAHDTTVAFQQTARFTPFADAPQSGVRVATTSTVQGADLLVSGLDGSGARARVRKYALERASQTATTLAPRLLDEIDAPPATSASWLGGS